MALIAYTFEGGTNGANIALSNTTTGDTDFDYVSNSSGAADYSTAHPAHGTLGGLFATSANSTSVAGWNQGTQNHAPRLYLYMTSLPPAAMQLVRYMTGTGGTGSEVLGLRVTAAGKLTIINSAFTTLWTSTTTLATATMYRVEWSYSSGSGAMTVYLYLGDSTSVTETSGAVTTAAPTWASFDFGAAFTAAQTYSGLYLDALAVNLGSLTLPGPAGATSITVTLTDDTGLTDGGETIATSLTDTMSLTGAATATVPGYIEHAGLRDSITVTGGTPIVPATPVAGFPQVIVEASLTDVTSTSGYLLLDDPVWGLDVGSLAPDVWLDISPFVLSVEVRRGSSRYNAPTLRYDPSTVTIKLDNSDGRFDPSNLTGPYVVAGISQIAPMRSVRVKAAFEGITYPLFTGYADSWTVSYPQGADSECVLQATDGQKVLANANSAAVDPIGAGETTGARIHRILDNVGWPTADRLIDAGNTAVQATTLAQAAWTEILLTADSENGQVYVDGSGRVVFRNRYDAIENPRSAVIQNVIGDGTGEIDYESLNVAYDDSQLINYARSSRVGGTEQIAQDADSQTTYGTPYGQPMIRTYQRNDLIMQSDDEAAQWGAMVLYQNSVPEMRATDVTVRAMDSDGLTACLSADFGDRVHTIRRPQARNGGVFEQDCFIRGLTHTITINSWVTQLVFQSATKWGFFVLDDPIRGVLDQNALIY